MTKGRAIPKREKSRDALRARYRELCQKYEQLVRRLEDVATDQIAVFQLGWWALRTSASALALVRNNTIYLCNDRWRQIDREPSGARGWESIPGGTPGTRAATHANLRELALAEVASLLEAGDEVARVTRYRRTGGTGIFDVRSEVLSAPRTVALLVHDVTAEATAENELREAREALHERHRMQSIGEVASGVAHDLNNILNVMRLRLSLIQSRPIDDAQATQLAALVRIVEDAAARVGRMQDLSRRPDDEAFELVDLRNVIDESVALAGTQLEQLSLHGARFRVVSDVPEDFQVRGNSAELKHLFVNLLLNARDAMPEGGAISIRGWNEDDVSVVSVADEGVGIPEEDLERIFESFYTTKGKEGTGLGLSMARGAMARIGGTITARNRGFAGAEFVLRFPRSFEPHSVELKRLETHLPPLDRSLRILLVDDDADCLAVTEEVLQHEGADVTAASSGADALSRLREHHYDLLLCDIGMPGMSGWEIAREARMRQPGLPIYMVTGWASEFASADERSRNVDGVLGKPFDLDELRGILARAAAPPQASGPQASGPRTAAPAG
jgi:signal transduction histidine kinase/ActR/RegA family two-component response regulator